MNYYEHHIGDYAEATAHLTFVEDAAYSRLLRKCYATEQPLPADVKQVQRLVMAHTKEEKVAVQTVLEEFFSLQPDGWHQERCDREIEEFISGEPERSAKKTNEDTRMKRHREERARLFSLLNEAGRHAPWNINMNDLRELVKRTCNASPETPVTETCNAPVTAPATPATATQTPDTRHQTPVINTRAKALLSSAKLPPCPHQSIVDLYLEVLPRPQFAGVSVLDDKRKKIIRECWDWVLTSKKPDQTRRADTSEKAMEWLRQFFDRAKENDFLMGRVPRDEAHKNWKPDIEYLLKPAGIKQVLEKTTEATA